jgi:hypothetical protein
MILYLSLNYKLNYNTCGAVKTIKKSQKLKGFLQPGPGFLLDCKNGICSPFWQLFQCWILLNKLCDIKDAAVPTKTLIKIKQKNIVFGHGADLTPWTLVFTFQCLLTNICCVCSINYMCSQSTIKYYDFENNNEINHCFKCS